MGRRAAATPAVDISLLPRSFPSGPTIHPIAHSSHSNRTRDLPFRNLPSEHHCHNTGPLLQGQYYRFWSDMGPTASWFLEKTFELMALLHASWGRPLQHLVCIVPRSTEVYMTIYSLEGSFLQALNSFKGVDRNMSVGVLTKTSPAHCMLLPRPMTEDVLNFGAACNSMKTCFCGADMKIVTRKYLVQATRR